MASDRTVDGPAQQALPAISLDAEFGDMSILQRDNPLFEESVDVPPTTASVTELQRQQQHVHSEEQKAIQDCMRADEPIADAHAAGCEEPTQGSGSEGVAQQEDPTHPNSWACLPQAVLRRLIALLSWQDVRVARMTCKNWRKAHALTVSCLTPTHLEAADVAELFPALMVLDMTQATQQEPESLKQQLLELSVACPYLGSLKLPENMKVDDLMLAVAAAFGSLTSLSLEGTSICTDSGSLSCLSMLDHLQALSLASTSGLNHIGVESLATLPSITKMSLSGCFEAAGSGIAKLAGITSLTSLDLEGCANLDDSVLAHFTTLTNLQTLNLSYCSQVTDKGIEILCDGVTAHSLYASGNPIGAIGAAFGELGRAMSKLHDTGRLVNLRSLSLSGCTEVTDHGISKLQSLTSLTHLDILGCWMVTGQGVAALASLSALESLSIEVKEGLDNSCLGALASLASLKFLRMERCHLEVTDHGIDKLEQLSQLRQLEIMYCTGVSDVFVATIGHLSGLLTLSLLKSQTISQGGLAALNCLRNLEHLDLTGCTDVNDIVFLCLKRLPLRSLSLAYCGTWTDEGLSSLATMTTLQQLDMAYTCTAVTDTSLQILSAGLAALTHLNLSGASQLSDAGIAHLQRNQRLQRLDLEGCIGLRDDAVVSISRLPQLTSLNLQECHEIGAAGVAFLTELSGLRELNLLDCPGGSSGVVEQISRLPFLTQLTVG